MNIIDRFKNQRVSQEIHFKNRVSSRVRNCYRLKTKKADQVSLRKTPESEKAHYGSLQTCGSVWSCPVCASIISERRKEDLQGSIDTWINYDPCNTVVMGSYTTPHYIFQSLAQVLALQDKAIRIMKQQPQKGRYKVYRTIMEEMMSIGSYTGRDITYGKNGWHPHRHEINFCINATEKQLKQWQFEFSYAFSIAFKKAGGVIKDLMSFLKRSVRLDQINDDDGYKRISSYVTTIEGKTWTLAQEATKGIIKTAKNGHITPFGMLEAIRQGDENSALYSVKFLEYAETMKGKKQFFPSPGLNKFLRLDWKTDEELMEENKAGDHFAFLTDQEWQQINSFDIRGEILELTRGINDFEFFDKLDSLLKQYQKKIA